MTGHWRRWPWLLLFVAGCVAEFFATWAKECAGERLRGGPGGGDDDGEVE